MTVTVEGPGGATIDFPDGTDAATIHDVMTQHFGGDGNAPAAPAPDIGSDVAKSAGIGVAKGVIGLAGLPAVTGSLIDRGANWLTDMLGFDPTASSSVITALRAAKDLPSAQSIQSAIEGTTGKFYEPQTIAGRYAQTLGEFVPGLVGGPEGLLLRAFTRVVAPAIASEGAGQATEGTAFEPYARIGAAILGGAGASATLEAGSNALGRALPATPSAPAVSVPAIASDSRPALPPGGLAERLPATETGEAAIRTRPAGIGEKQLAEPQLGEPKLPPPDAASGIGAAPDSAEAAASVGGIGERPLSPPPSRGVGAADAPNALENEGIGTAGASSGRLSLEARDRITAALRAAVDSGNLTQEQAAALLQRANGAAGGGSAVPDAAISAWLPKYDRKTTRGVLITNEGDVVPLQSGRPGKFWNYPSAKHAEGKGAIWMRENGSSGGVLFHNNTDGTCGWCHAQLERLLPSKAELDVVTPPDAVPKNANAVAAPSWYVGDNVLPKPPPRPIQQPDLFGTQP